MQFFGSNHSWNRADITIHNSTSNIYIYIYIYIYNTASSISMIRLICKLNSSMRNISVKIPVQQMNLCNWICIYVYYVGSHSTGYEECYILGYKRRLVHWNNRRFGGIYRLLLQVRISRAKYQHESSCQDSMLVICSAYSSLKMEAIRSSETSVDF
jgi:hypothetical protein